MVDSSLKKRFLQGGKGGAADRVSPGFKSYNLNLMVGGKKSGIVSLFQLLNSKKELIRLYHTIKDLNINSEEYDKDWVDQFTQAMNDDFNTPIALSVLFQLSHEINKNSSSVLASTLKYLAGILGFLQEDPEAFLQSGFAEDDKESIDTLIEERIQARAERNWARADQIRADLLSRGIELEDGEKGTTWRKVLD